MYMSGIDRGRVKSSFHRHAGEYDRYALVQKSVVARLAEVVEKTAPEPSRVLDIGTGTGALLRRLAGIFPGAAMAGVDLALGMCRTARQELGDTYTVGLFTADAERLPFAPGSFDLVVSSSTFQWLPTLDVAFSEVLRVLAPGGIFAFALFGESTLYELKESYRSALSSAGRLESDRTHGFRSVDDVSSALTRTGFSDVRVWRELEVELHDDVPGLLRSLKRIGAGNAAPTGSRGLSERRVMLEMMETYRREYSVENGVPATYEVIYGVGKF